MVIRDGSVDAEATDSLRSTPRPPRPQVDFGPERAVWEQVFDDATMCALVSALLPYPAALRMRLRQDLMQRLLPRLGEVSIPDLIPDPAPLRAELSAAIESLASGAGLPPD